MLGVSDGIHGGIDETTWDMPWLNWFGPTSDSFGHGVVPLRIPHIMYADAVILIPEAARLRSPLCILAQLHNSENRTIFPRRC